MLPISHEVHIQAHGNPAQGALLAEAFSDFISASARLELSYRDLQVEVAELSVALSERNQALDQSLSENRTMGLTLDRILETIPCGVLVVRADGTIRLINPEAERLLTLSAAQMPTLAGVERHIGLALVLEPENVGPTAEQELSFETSEGKRWIAVRQVWASETDRRTGKAKAEAVLTLRDVSGRKRLELEREKARDAVALAQVSALLAHEIRNPLASLELFAGLISDSPERRDEWISHLRAGIRSLSGTVNNVLTLHGGVASAGHFEMNELELATEAALAVGFLQPLAQQARVDLLLDVQGEALSVRANRSAFHQLLLNLCSNALRHTPAGGSVRIVCGRGEHGKNSVRVHVIDTGCGIPKEHLPKLFEGGFSGSGITPGLGLAVCDRLMQQHGGKIHVHSRAGQGSTFTLEFPSA